MHGGTPGAIRSWKRERSLLQSLQTEHSPAWIWTCGFQNFKRIHLCCFCPLVCGNVLWKPWGSNTDVFSHRTWGAYLALSWVMFIGELVTKGRQEREWKIKLQRKVQRMWQVLWVRTEKQTHLRHSRSYQDWTNSGCVWDRLAGGETRDKKFAKVQGRVTQD